MAKNKTSTLSRLENNNCIVNDIYMLKCETKQNKKSYIFIAKWFGHLNLISPSVLFYTALIPVLEIIIYENSSKLY